MVYRIYVEKKPAFALEAAALLKDARELLGIEGLRGLRLLNRYDAEGLERSVFDGCRQTIFSEPQLDDTYDELPEADFTFAVEYLPGQFDQRADSCAQCIQIANQGERPTIRSARVYLLNGELTAAELASLKQYVINPVDSHEVSLAPYVTLQSDFAAPEAVEILHGFNALDANGLATFLKARGLAMDGEDLAFLQRYFIDEQRDPTITEIRMLDTYWSDHCRHTTFMTAIENVTIEDARCKATYDAYLKIRAELGREHKPITLMDLATIGARYLKATGALTDLDESEEINACTIKIDVEVDGQSEPWLLLFKNETHNHPTEIEPFGGAATCIGGAIRDPLSGRGYVYQAMRVTGAADPLRPLEETLPGKLPQRQLVQTAAAGYSSYGNQIGLATGIVDELYHPGYVAKHLETGAVIAAAPAKNVRRETPQPGDAVLLLGGRTGRDGCGGATGSSKSHSKESLSSCGAEVQKGNAPEERKLQRLFRNEAAARLIKRCNDFGAGGVSVAIGELADGLSIDLDRVPKKYEGLDGTELAISESQERMAVVVAAEDVAAFKALAAAENLETSEVAVVTAEPRLVMRWQGRVIVDVARDFLNSAGAQKTTRARVCAPAPPRAPKNCPDFGRFRKIVADLNVCSKRGLAERFDSTIGAATVLMPFGGKLQRTPAQVMAAKLPVLHGETDDCSLMSFGYDPYVTAADPYLGGYLAVVDSVAKIVAAGGRVQDIHLSMQEFFEKLRGEEARWGKPMAALLGALQAQLDLSVAAIGGKDSMSGSFEDIDVPPTIISFAVAMTKSGTVISPEFKRANAHVVLIEPAKTADGLYDKADLNECYRQVAEAIAQGRIDAAMAVSTGAVAATVFKMAVGNDIGFRFDEDFAISDAFSDRYGAIVACVTDDLEIGRPLGHTTEQRAITWNGGELTLDDLNEIYEGKLETVYPSEAAAAATGKLNFDCAAKTRVSPAIRCAKPRVLIPVFPGNNCEYDTARAFEKAGAQVECLVVRNLTSADIAESVERFAELLQDTQIILIPGGFSGGDEPDGSGKFITSFFRNPRITENVRALLARDGLIGGICNGFQALIKLGLLPDGDIRLTDDKDATLTYNLIGRHQSRLIRARVCANRSPWLSYTEVGDVHLLPISHGEGRFIASEELIAKLAQNGQIATVYADENGVALPDITVNPNGSVCNIEGITSPDGRIFGRMAHAERSGHDLYKNVPGNSDCPMFRGAVDYFK